MNIGQANLIEHAEKLYQSDPELARDRDDLIETMDQPQKVPDNDHSSHLSLIMTF